MQQTLEGVGLLRGPEGPHSEFWWMLGWNFKAIGFVSAPQPSLLHLFRSSLLTWGQKSSSKCSRDYCLSDATCRTEKHWLSCKHRALSVWDLQKPPSKDVSSWTKGIVCCGSYSSFCCSLSWSSSSTWVLSNVKDLNYFCSLICAFWHL